MLAVFEFVSVVAVVLLFEVAMAFASKAQQIIAIDQWVLFYVAVCYVSTIFQNLCQRKF